jgi:RimJ/RimL family protein N-acetyltransferase
MSDVLVRPISPDDCLVDLTRLINAAYKKNLDMGFRFVATWQGPDITARRIEGAQCLVAEQGGKVVGTATIKQLKYEGAHPWYQRPGTWHLGQFAVEPDLQGGGVGRALMDAVEKLTFDLGGDELSLDTAEGAQHLISYYDRRGYRFIEHIDHRPETNYLSVILSKRIRPTLRTERLVLRPILLSEVDTIDSFWDSENYRATYPPDYWTEDFGRGVLRAFAEKGLEWPMLNNRWGIEVEGQIRGTIRLDWDRETRSRRGTVGYGLAESTWGKGYATEAVQEVLRYGFEELKLHRIAAWVFANNPRSARVLEKCGFVDEGADRQAVKWADGWMDDRRYGILVEEWQALQAKE